MSLDVGIKVDPADSVAKADAVTASLHRTEDQGIAAGKAMLGVSGSFKSLAAAIEQERAALERCSTVHDRLTRQAQPLAQGFRGLAEAIEREKSMFQQIRGPMEQYEKDVQTLNALQAKGTITANEYASALARAKQSAGMANASGAVSLPGGAAAPGLGSRVAGAADAAGFGLPLGPAAAIGAVVGVGNMIDSLTEQAQANADVVTRFENSAQKFTTAGRGTNQVIAQQIELGHALHLSGQQTIGIYDSVGDATERLNLTTSEHVALTKTLGQNALLAGKSVDSAGEMINRLGVAFETGADAGRALRGLFKDFPDLANQLTQGLGLTREQIVEMAHDGRLGFEQIAHAMIDSAAIGDETFKKFKRTNAETWEQFKESMLLAQQSGASMWESMQAGARAANGEIHEVITTTQMFAEQAQMAQRALDARFREIVTGVLADTGNAAVSVGKTLEGVGHQFADIDWGAATKKIATANHELERMNELARRLLGGETPADRAIRQGAADRAAFQAGVEGDAQREIDDEKNTYQSGYDAMVAKIQAQEEWRAAVAKGADEWRQKQAEIAKAAEESAQKTREAWASGLGKIGGDFIAAARAGQQSWSQMLENVGTSLAKLTLQMAAMQLIAGGGGGAVGGQLLTGLLGGLGGGATGFDHLIGGGRGLELPGFARGGDAMIGGTGATDSKLIAFWGTPGESVHVRTPSQRAEMASPAVAPATQVVVQLQNDKRDMVAAMGSYAGAREVVRLDRKYRRR